VASPYASVAVRLGLSRARKPIWWNWRGRGRCDRKPPAATRRTHPREALNRLILVAHFLYRSGAYWGGPVDRCPSATSCHRHWRALPEARSPTVPFTYDNSSSRGQRGTGKQADPSAAARLPSLTDPWARRTTAGRGEAKTIPKIGREAILNDCEMSVLREPSPQQGICKSDMDLFPMPEIVVKAGRELLHSPARPRRSLIPRQKVSHLV
jgi:hypothetical protein